MTSAVVMNDVLLVEVMVVDDTEDFRRAKTRLVHARAVVAIEDIKNLTVKLNEALDTLEQAVPPRENGGREHDC